MLFLNKMIFFFKTYRRNNINQPTFLLNFFLMLSGIFALFIFCFFLEQLQSRGPTSTNHQNTVNLPSNEKIENMSISTEKTLKQENAEKFPNDIPTQGKVTSPFGERLSPIDGKKEFHNGIDIANDIGTEIFASASGIVTFSSKNEGYGNKIIISHGNGYRSLYAHNDKNLVKVGQKVKKGELIARMGNTGRTTGSHLHFEIHYKGIQIDPQTILQK